MVAPRCGKPYNPPEVGFGVHSVACGIKAACQ